MTDRPQFGEPVAPRRVVLAAGVTMLAAGGLAAPWWGRGALAPVVGAIAVGAVLVLRMTLGRGDRSGPPEPPADDPAANLRRWAERTETLVARAASTRGDWDRYLRPMLARQFALATSARRAGTPAARQATAQLLFGPQLWGWVDPDGADPARATEPGPGRDVLAAALAALERI